MIQVHILLLGAVPGGNWGEKTFPLLPVIGMTLSTPSSLHGPTAAVNESGDNVNSSQREGAVITRGADVSFN